MKLFTLIKRNKKMAMEVIIAAFSMIAVLLSMLVDFSIISIPDVITLKVKTVEELFFSLFTVQASIATVSIAIVSIITGLVNEYVFGISISGFITNIKPGFFKHNRLIIANLVISVLNYFFVSCSLFNSCIAAFVVSVAITILLINEVYVVFLGKNKVRQEIHDYVLDKYDYSIIKDLGSELVSAIETGDSLTANEDYKIIKEIFEIEVTKNDFRETEVIKQISTMICDAFTKTISKQDSVKINGCLLFICEIYEIANKKETKPLYLEIADGIMHDFDIALSKLQYEQLKNDFAYVRLHTQLYKNLKGKEQEEIKDSGLKYYASNMYNVLIKKNANLKKDEKNTLIEKLNDMVYNALFCRTFYTNEKILDDLLTYEMCNLYVTMIYDGACEDVKRLFFDEMKYGFDKERNSLVYFVLLMYLYYLSIREELVEGKEIQKYAKKILEETYEINKNFVFYIDILKIARENLSFIRSFMRSWEYFGDGNAKWLVTDYVVDDFFVCSSLEKFWEKDLISEVVKLLSPNSMFSIYSRYFSRDGFRKIHLDFAEIFNKDNVTEFLDDKILFLRDVFNELYRDETIKEGESEKITKEQSTNFAKMVSDAVHQTIEKDLRIFDFKNFDDSSNITVKDNVVIWEFVLSNHWMREKKLEKHIYNDIFTHTITTFIKNILNKIDYRPISYKDKTKQKTLIGMTEELKIRPNVAIGNRDEFWGEEEPDILKEYTANMKKIKYPGGYNYYFLLDSSLVEFSMDNVRVNCFDLAWDDMKNCYRENDDGNFEFNVANDIYIPLTKTEIEKYMISTHKKVLVLANIKVRLKDDKIGTGFCITT